MTNAKYFTKAEMREEIKKSYANLLVAGAAYKELKGSTHAASHKMRNHNARSKTIGFTCYYYSKQKNEHFTKAELAQAWLDIITVTHEMWEEIGEAAAAQAK